MFQDFKILLFLFLPFWGYIHSFLSVIFTIFFSLSFIYLFIHNANFRLFPISFFKKKYFST